MQDPTSRKVEDLETRINTIEVITKSEFLDILGAKLYANFSQTRSENGKIVVEKIEDTINLCLCL